MYWVFWVVVALAVAIQVPAVSVAVAFGWSEIDPEGDAMSLRSALDARTHQVLAWPATRVSVIDGKLAQVPVRMVPDGVAVGVQLAAVVGVAVDGLTKPKAFITLRGQGTGSDALAAELQEWVRERLSKHKYPREVEFRSELPLNDRGKVDKKALRAEGSA